MGLVKSIIVSDIMVHVQYREFFFFYQFFSISKEEREEKKSVNERMAGVAARQTPLLVFEVI